MKINLPKIFSVFLGICVFLGFVFVFAGHAQAWSYCNNCAYPPPSVSCTTCWNAGETCSEDDPFTPEYDPVCTPIEVCNRDQACSGPPPSAEELCQLHPDWSICSSPNQDCHPVTNNCGCGICPSNGICTDNCPGHVNTCDPTSACTNNPPLSGGGGSSCGGCQCGGPAGTRNSCVYNDSCGGVACCDDRPECGGFSGGDPLGECNNNQGTYGPPPTNCCSIGCRANQECFWNETWGNVCNDPGWICNGNANTYGTCTTTVGSCGLGTQMNECGTTRACCTECGPNWGACTAPSFTRTGTFDCNTDSTTTEACQGFISGTLFDATDIDSCAQMGLADKIPGGRVVATSTQNLPGVPYNSSASNSDGQYVISGVHLPETYALDHDMSGVDPSNGVYLSVPKFVCESSTATLTTQAETVNRNFGFWKVYNSWFQVVGGSVRAESADSGVVTSHIPPTCLPGNGCSPYLLRRDTSGIVGSAGFAVTGESGSSGGTVVTAYSGGDLSKLSQDDANVVAYAKRQIFQENFDYFANRVYSMGVTPQSDFSPEAREDLSKPDPDAQPPTNAGRAAYYANGDVTIQSPWTVDAGESIVILIQGNLDIQDTITVAPGGFLAMIASGDITISNTVGTSTYTSETPQVEGVYIADGLFTVESNGSGTSDLKFVGAGTFVGWGGINLARDFRDDADPQLGLNNNATATELFIARPDFAIYAPQEIKRPSYIWQEVAP